MRIENKMPGGAEILPAYKLDLFVGRKAEIEQITNWVKQPQPRVRALNIAADPGGGMTFLLRHLTETVLPGIKNVVPVMLCFGNKPSGDLPENIIIPGPCVTSGYDKGVNLLENVNKFLEIELPPNSSLAEKVDRVRRFIQAKPDSRYVFLVDDFNADWGLTESWETHLLRNWLTLPNVMFITAEKGRPYPNKVPYLIEAIRFELGPFSQDETALQLAKTGNFSKLPPSEIQRLGGGWPVNNILLAPKATSQEAVAFAGEAHLSGLSDNARQTTEILALTNGGDQNLVAHIAGMSDKQAKEAIKELNARRLVSWEDGGYRVAGSVGVIVKHNLMYNQPDQWARIYRQAEQFFLGQVGTYGGRFDSLFQEIAAEQRALWSRYHFLFEAKPGEEFTLRLDQWDGLVKILPDKQLQVLTSRAAHMPEVLDLRCGIAEDWFVDPSVKVLEPEA